MAPRLAPLFAYVGCFTTATRGARGNGIDVHAIDPANGAWTHIQHLPGLLNPSYLALAHDRRTLYAMHGDADYASAFARNATTGLLRPLGQAATGGSNVVHLAVAPSGRHLIVANYGSGSVAVLPMRVMARSPRSASLPPCQAAPDRIPSSSPDRTRTRSCSTHPGATCWFPTRAMTASPCSRSTLIQARSRCTR